MTTDRELLELAAKAAGYEITNWGGADYYSHRDGEVAYIQHEGGRDEWNPLTDDGDALRLAVSLGLAIIPYPIYSRPKHSVIVKRYESGDVLRGVRNDAIEQIQVYSEDAEAATRRAIVRAAAELGKTAP